jgi:hypothetical protein
VVGLCHALLLCHHDRHLGGREGVGGRGCGGGGAGGRGCGRTTADVSAHDAVSVVVASMQVSL